MNRTTFITLLALSLMVCACKDAPPAYDNINDIIVKGEHMTASEYHARFCKNASPEIINHVRCMQAASKSRSDDLREQIERDMKRLEKTSNN